MIRAHCQEIEYRRISKEAVNGVMLRYPNHKYHNL